MILFQIIYCHHSQFKNVHITTHRLGYKTLKQDVMFWLSRDQVTSSSVPAENELEHPEEDIQKSLTKPAFHCCYEFLCYSICWAYHSPAPSVCELSNGGQVFGVFLFEVKSTLRNLVHTFPILLLVHLVQATVKKMTKKLFCHSSTL